MAKVLGGFHVNQCRALRQIICIKEFSEIQADHVRLAEALGRRETEVALIRPGPIYFELTPEIVRKGVHDGPQKFTLILSREAKQLLAMDRYERRALLRRKVALRALDDMRRSDLFVCK